MSLVLSGRRRMYVLVTFRARIGEPPKIAAPLRRVSEALSDSVPSGMPVAAGASPRLVISTRVQRRWGGSVFGFSFFVVALERPDSWS